MTGPLSGLQRLLSILTGERQLAGMAALAAMELWEAAPGRVVFGARPTRLHYNHGGSVHGGYTSTVLDTAMGCAAQTLQPADRAVTTVELKVMFHRAITEAVGELTATGTVLSSGRRLVFTEGRVNAGDGRLLASATSTLMVIELPTTS